MGSTENEQSNEAGVKSGLKVSSTKTALSWYNWQRRIKKMIREALTRKMCGLLGPHQCQHILVGIGQAREKGQEIIMEDKSYFCKRRRQVI